MTLKTLSGMAVAIDSGVNVKRGGVVVVRVLGERAHDFIRVPVQTQHIIHIVNAADVSQAAYLCHADLLNSTGGAEELLVNLVVGDDVG